MLASPDIRSPASARNPGQSGWDRISTAFCRTSSLSFRFDGRPRRRVHHRLVALRSFSCFSSRRTCRSRQLHLRRRLLLRDQLLLCLLQHYQPVSIPLGHRQNSLFFQLPSLTLSIGHFYLALIGHSHVAATSGKAFFTAYGSSCRLLRPRKGQRREHAHLRYRFADVRLRTGCNSPFVGTWKMNKSKSKIDPRGQQYDSLTVQFLQEGSTLKSIPTVNGTVVPASVMDGKEHAVPAGTPTRLGATHYVSTVNGKLLRPSSRETAKSLEPGRLHCLQTVNQRLP